MIFRSGFIYHGLSLKKWLSMRFPWDFHRNVDIVGSLFQVFEYWVDISYELGHSYKNKHVYSVHCAINKI